MVATPVLKRARQRIFHVLETRPRDSRLARLAQWLILGLIFLNTVAVILDSIESVWRQYSNFLYGFEVVSVFVFTLEYLLRLWTCVEDQRWRGGIRGRFRFALTWMALIDLLAIMPFFLPALFHHLDLRFLRAIRLLRVFRILKVGRYSESLKMLGRVLRAKREELYITLSVVLILLVVSSSLMYLAEHQAQPKAFGNIPEAMWWAVVTLTTVGYGDVYPVTVVGKCIAAVISLLGIALFSMPTAILAAGFIEEVHNRAKPASVCPHCGGVIEPIDAARR